MGALTHNGEVLQRLPANASQINFDNDGTDLSATQTENAIKEVNTKANTLQSEKADTDMVASDFSTAVSYTAGDYCTYGGKFYKFKNNHSGAWSAADVDEIKIAGELSSLKSGSINDHNKVVLNTWDSSHSENKNDANKVDALLMVFNGWDPNITNFPTEAVNQFGTLVTVWGRYGSIGNLEGLRSQTLILENGNVFARCYDPSLSTPWTAWKSNLTNYSFTDSITTHGYWVETSISDITNYSGRVIYGYMIDATISRTYTFAVPVNNMPVVQTPIWVQHDASDTGNEDSIFVAKSDQTNALCVFLGTNIPDMTLQLFIH